MLRTPITNKSFKPQDRVICNQKTSINYRETGTILAQKGVKVTVLWDKNNRKNHCSVSSVDFNYTEILCDVIKLLIFYS